MKLLGPTVSLLLLSLALALGQASLSAAPGDNEVKGKVVEVIDAAGYTYVLLDTGSRQVWAAATQFAVKAGDTVALAEAMPMTKYHSKTLNRTFDLVYFSGQASVNGRPAAAAGTRGGPPAGHASPAGAQKGGAAMDLSGIKKATDGQTVAEVFAGKAKLAGKPVTVRGRVVKFNANIMGRNWLHVRDGSGAEGTNDLTVTTATPVKVGDLVLVIGKLSVDRDFGAGYKYGLIVEDAKVVVE